MASEQQTETNKLMQEMMKKITMLEEKVDSIQNSPVLESKVDSDDKMEAGSGDLLQLTETTRSFLEATFSTIMSNEDCRKRVATIWVSDCDQVRCPKLDGVLKVVLPKDAIKADRYLPHLQQFWLDAVVTLAAVLESAEAGDLKPEKAVSATQTALYLMGNAHQQMAQERQKRSLTFR